MLNAPVSAGRCDPLNIMKRCTGHGIGVQDRGDGLDSVDQASQSIEKELLFELSDNERGTLDMIEAAIRKVDNGTYGLCEATQRPIGRARLEAIPYCRYSIEYQNQLENKETEAEPGPDFSTIGEFGGGGGEA